jgi:hypothetical protein
MKPVIDGKNIRARCPTVDRYRGVADDARFVKFLRRQDFRSTHLFQIGKAALAILSDFVPFLGRIVFVGEGADGCSFGDAGRRARRADDLRSDGNAADGPPASQAGIQSRSRRPSLGKMQAEEGSTTVWIYDTKQAGDRDISKVF